MLIQTLPVADLVAGEMVRGRDFTDRAPPRGVVHYEHSRGGVVLVPRTMGPNTVTNTAKNNLLDGWFNNGSRNSAYYIGLVDTSTFSTFQASDTITSHVGWTEFLAYNLSGDATHRGSWGQGAASGQQVTNAAPVTYTFTATGSVTGIFVTADQTKGSSGSLLWATAAFTAPLAVQSGDQLKVTYTVQL